MWKNIFSFLKIVGYPCVRRCVVWLPAWSVTHYCVLIRPGRQGKWVRGREEDTREPNNWDFWMLVRHTYVHNGTLTWMERAFLVVVCPTLQRTLVNSSHAMCQMSPLTMSYLPPHYYERCDQNWGGFVPIIKLRPHIGLILFARRMDYSPPL